ncbi:hypothetical protein ES703_83748 [subsurface metagenome]
MKRAYFWPDRPKKAMLSPSGDQLISLPLGGRALNRMYSYERVYPCVMFLMTLPSFVEMRRISNSPALKFIVSTATRSPEGEME